MRRVTRRILSLYRRRGHESYGEDTTQLQHALQSARCAEIDRPHDTELVVAALLHDIGHLLDAPQTMGDFGNVDHETLGADFLRAQGFGERVCAPVRYHVDAKRYLVAVDSAYADRLSDASRETLRMQGGPMTSKEEIQSFERLPFLDDILRLRSYDERGKNVEDVEGEIEAYANCIESVLRKK